MPPQPGQTGLPSVSGQRRRKNTFTTPPSDMRMTFAALSERAAAESRKCCAMPTCRTKSVRPSCQREGASTRRITGEESRQWRQLHNAAFFPQHLAHRLVAQVGDDLQRHHLLGQQPKRPALLAHRRIRAGQSNQPRLLRPTQFARIDTRARLAQRGGPVANDRASLPIAYRLYLPQDWEADVKRRARAG